jgi:hypothetical protein
MLIKHILMLWFCVPSATICHVVYKISVVFLDGCSFLIDLLSPLCSDLMMSQKIRRGSCSLNMTICWLVLILIHFVVNSLHSKVSTCYSKVSTPIRENGQLFRGDWRPL